MNQTKKLTIWLALLTGAMVVFGLFFKTEIKNKIDEVRNSQPAVVEEDTTTPQTQSIEIVF